MFLTLLACDATIGSLPEDTGPDTTVKEVDADTDTDTDTDADTDSDTDADLTGLTLDPDTLSLGARDLGEVQAIASYSDGSTADVTARATWTTQDDSVAGVWVPGEIRPLGPGSTKMVVSFDGETARGDVSVDGTGTPRAGELVFNEVLFDPASGADTNGDGVSDTTDDEFVEIVNVSTTTLDLAGLTLHDQDNEAPRHTFPANTVLRPGEAVVVFGSGTAAISEPNAIFQVCDDDDSGLDIGLALSNDGDVVTLRDGGDRLASASYGDGEVSDASLVLDPELTGTSYDEHPHTGATAWSPGTLSDGSAMPGPAGIFAP